MYRVVLAMAAVVCMGGGGGHQHQQADVVLHGVFPDGTILNIRTHLNNGNQVGVGSINNPGIAREKLTITSGTAVIGTSTTLSGNIEGVGTFTLTATVGPPSTISMTMTGTMGPVAGLTGTVMSTTSTLTFQ